MNIRRKHIESIAQQILEEFHEPEGSFVNVKKIAKSMNVDVRPLPAPDDLSGFFFRDPATGRTIIGINQNHHENRQRFTLAHELGHMILHSYEDVHYDRKGYGYGFGRVMMRDSNSSTGEYRDEIEANCFAAELLMPRQLLMDKLFSGNDRDTLDEDFDQFLYGLAKELHVSTAALTNRLTYLDFIAKE